MIEKYFLCIKFDGVRIVIEEKEVLIDSDVFIRVLEYFVYVIRVKGSVEDVCYSFGSYNIGFLSVEFVNVRFGFLIVNDNEGMVIFIEGESYGYN